MTHEDHKNQERFIRKYCETPLSLIQSSDEIAEYDFNNSHVLLTKIPENVKLFGGIMPPSIKTLEICQSSIARHFVLPSKMRKLIFYQCDLPEEISFEETHFNNTTQEYTCDIVDCTTLQRLQNIPINNMMTIRCSENSSLNYIHSKNTSQLHKILLIGCKNLNKLSYINIQNIRYLSCDTLTVFDDHITNYNMLALKCNNVRDYRGIENLNVDDQLSLNGFRADEKMHYAINILLCKAKTITLGTFFYNYEEVNHGIILDIINKFVVYDNRHEYMMDCAIELIDAGYPMVAEL